MKYTLHYPDTAFYRNTVERLRLRAAYSAIIFPSLLSGGMLAFMFNHLIAQAPADSWLRPWHVLLAWLGMVLFSGVFAIRRALAAARSQAQDAGRPLLLETGEDGLHMELPETGWAAFYPWAQVYLLHDSIQAGFIHLGVSGRLQSIPLHETGQDDRAALLATLKEKASKRPAEPAMEKQEKHEAWDMYSRHFSHSRLEVPAMLILGTLLGSLCLSSICAITCCGNTAHAGNGLAICSLALVMSMGCVIISMINILYPGGRYSRRLPVGQAASAAAGRESADSIRIDCTDGTWTRLPRKDIQAVLGGEHGHLLIHGNKQATFLPAGMPIPEGLPAPVPMARRTRHARLIVTCAAVLFLLPPALLLAYLAIWGYTPPPGS